MMNEKISITIPYRGYVKSLGLFGPVVQPISVTKAQALVLLRTGLQVVRVDRAGNRYVLTAENINNVCVVDTVNTDTVTTVPKVNTPAKETVATQAVAQEVATEEVVKNYAWYQANIDTLTVEDVEGSSLTKNQIKGLVKKVNARLEAEATANEVVEGTEEFTEVVEGSASDEAVIEVQGDEVVETTTNETTTDEVVE